MILTEEQIIELTQRKKYYAQCRQLTFLGIPYRRRINGSPVVLEADLHPPVATRRRPRLELLNGAKAD